MRLLPTLLLAFLLAASGSARPAGAQQAPRTPEQLARAIDAVLDAQVFENASWGVMVVDLEAGETLYRRNAEKSFVPASNVKLYTTAAALDRLGPDYRYHTRLYARGPVVDGVLQGDLVVRGAGDPAFGGRYDPETGRWREFYDPTMIFRAWADSLRAAGITAVAGGVIGDDDVVDDEPLGLGWNWDDLTYYYAAQMSGLSFGDNVVQVEITGRQPGQRGAVTWHPYETDYVEIVNETQTARAGTAIREGYHRAPGTNRIRLYSRVPAGGVDTEEITVDNPTRFTAHVLRETLRRDGLRVDGEVTDVDDLDARPDYTDGSLRLVAGYTSLPLRDLARIVNKASQNLYAEMMLKTLGAERPAADATSDADPGSTAMGLAAAAETFARAGIDVGRLQLVDGSGLSRRNLVTPEMTMALLRYAWTHHDPAVRTAFYESLPVAGVDGTLRNRMQSGPVFRNVRAKTGSLGNVSSLSGYVHDADGRPLAFVMMSNHHTTPSRRVRDAQDAIAALLARFRSRL